MFTIVQDIAIGIVCIIFIFCMFMWVLNLCWLFTKLTPLKKFCHDILDWHKPEKNQFASYGTVSKCKICGCDIVSDGACGWKKID